MSYWYLGSPYSKYPLGIDAAYLAASANAGLLINAGVLVFSPIAHSHPICMHGDVDPLSHEIWLRLDKPLMDAACGLIVLMEDGWQESYGLNHEREVFERAGKPIVHMKPGIVPQELL